MTNNGTCHGVLIPKTNLKIACLNCLNVLFLNNVIHNN